MAVEFALKDNRKRFDEVIAAFDDSPGATVKFGSVGPRAAAGHIRNDGTVTDTPVATILSFHEYGLGVPERSVLRAWTDENKRSTIGDAFRTGVLSQFSGYGSTADTLDRIGKVATEGMQRRVRGFVPPPLSPVTMANPYRDQRGIPLLDTTQILESLGHETDR